MPSILHIFNRLRVPNVSTPFRASCTKFSGRSAASQILLIGLAFCAVWPNELRANEQTARLTDGTEVRGKLVSRPKGDLWFRTGAANDDIPILRVESVRMRSQKPVVMTSAPLKRVWLRGGESCSGKIVSCSTTSVVLEDLHTGAKHEIPIDAVAAIEQPQGSINLVFEDFDGDQLAGWPAAGARLSKNRSRSGESSLQCEPDAKPLIYQLSEPLSNGSVQFHFWDSASRSAGSSWILECRFETQLGERRIRVEMGADDPNYSVTAPLGPRLSRQLLRRSPGWHLLKIQFDRLSTLISIDGNLLASAAATQGELKSMRIFASTSRRDAAATGPSSTSALWIDDFQITEYVAARPLELPRRKQDILLTTSGDEIFGTVEELTLDNVSLRGKFGTVTVPWRELRAVLRRETDYAYAPVTGVISRLLVHEDSPTPSSSPHELIGAIESVSDTEILFQHPVLGRCSYALSRVIKVEPVFQGSSRLLFPDRRHLGDEIRRDFRHPVPESQMLELTFDLDSPPEGTAYISLRAAHLEPSGAATAAGPFLSQLRKGHLGTSAIVNGRMIGRLNDHIHVRAPVDAPARIRLRIPQGVLKAGENRLLIRQKPSEQDKTDFDDCEISRIVLEVEESKSDRSQ